LFLLSPLLFLIDVVSSKPTISRKLKQVRDRVAMVAWLMQWKEIASRTSLSKQTIPLGRVLVQKAITSVPGSCRSRHTSKALLWVWIISFTTTSRVLMDLLMFEAIQLIPPGRVEQT
jgi:hypothetical protein